MLIYLANVKLYQLKGLRVKMFMKMRFVEP